MKPSPSRAQSKGYIPDLDGWKNSNLNRPLTHYLLWYKIGTLLCTCCRFTVLSQHTQNGVQSHERDAIGLSQGGALGKDPILRRQVQNFAAHDTVGYVFTYVETPPEQQCSGGVS